VVGEEGTSLDDFLIYLKGEFLDAVYLQQNSFDAIDAAVSTERQSLMFGRVVKVLGSGFNFKDKEEARGWFNKLRQMFLDANSIEWATDKFRAADQAVLDFLAAKVSGLDAAAGRIIENLERAV
jgi:V/A-type H+-transporting ATPase subunit A